jgi:type VI secretion system secreted protein VgrG
VTQNVQYRFESEGLPGPALGTMTMRVVQALDEPYTAEVLVQVQEADADVSAMLGKNATLTIARPHSAQRIHGIVRSIRPRGDNTLAPGVNVEVVPALWMLSLRRNTRMFQNKTAPEILRAVLEDGLGPYGRKHEQNLSASYPRREYCLQYQETDLAFVHRIMEEEGISYSFDHDGDVEQLILRDTNGAYPPLVSSSQGALRITGADHADDDAIHSLRRAHHATTTSVTVRDFDWTLGGYVFTERAEGEDARGRDREHYEHGNPGELRVFSYSPGPRRYQAHDAATQKQSRLEAHVAQAIVGHGTGRVVTMAPGMTFEIAGHEDPATEGQYLITRVLHLAQGLNAADADGYHNRFECIPIDTPHRPRRKTEKPRIESIQTAVVTGPAGEEIHVDEHGRIKARFHWDRENPADETSSCWIRVQQAWAGDGWGFWWVPRIGMEVVVQFVDGDPDRPLVTGAVYDGTNSLPYPLPDEKTKSTIKSNSSLGGGGFNEFRFEDKAGSEEIFTHAQKDYNEVVENDHNTLVHNNQTVTVDVDQTQTIGANQTETVHGNQSMTVDGNRTVHVKANFDETVDGTETRHVVGNVTETFGANEDRLVAGNVTENIGASETRAIAASQKYTVGGSQTLTVVGASDDTIGGPMSETVLGGITTFTPANIALTSAGGWTVTTGGTITIVAPAGMQVLIPGGNKRADSFHFWTSSMEKKTGGFKLEVVGFASEIVGIETGFTNYKYEETGAFFDRTAIKLWKKVTKNRFDGVVCKFGGPEIDPAQTVHR